MLFLTRLCTELAARYLWRQLLLGLRRAMPRLVRHRRDSLAENRGSAPRRSLAREPGVNRRRSALPPQNADPARAPRGNGVGPRVVASPTQEAVHPSCCAAGGPCR
eukprot:scaffold262513_cov32-Tisochrysis_lutea.AAC.1